MIRQYKKLSTLFVISSLSLVVAFATASISAAQENDETYKDIPWTYPDGYFDKVYPYPPQFKKEADKNIFIKKILENRVGQSNISLNKLRFSDENPDSSRIAQCRGLFEQFIQDDTIKFLEPTVTTNNPKDENLYGLTQVCPNISPILFPWLGKPDEIDRKIHFRYETVKGEEAKEWIRELGYPFRGTANFKLYKLPSDNASTDFAIYFERIYPTYISEQANKVPPIEPKSIAKYIFVSSSTCKIKFYRDVDATSAYERDKTMLLKDTVSGLVETSQGIRLLQLNYNDKFEKIQMHTYSLNPRQSIATHECVATLVN